MTQAPMPDAVVASTEGTAQPEPMYTEVRKIIELHGYQRSVMQVHQEFDQLDPGKISDACVAWKKAADELYALADGLKTQAAAPLNIAWASPASPAAQQQLQAAESTVRALANDCLQMARATDYAAQYAQWYKDNLPSYADSVGTAVKGTVTGNGLLTAGADAATQHMVNLLGRYNEVIAILPNSVQGSIAASKSERFNIDQGPGGGSGGGSTSAPRIPGGPGHVGTSVPHGSFQGGPGVPSGPNGGPLTGGSGSPTGAGTSGLPANDPYAAGSSLAGTGLGGGLSSFAPGGLGTGVSGLGAGTSGLGAGLGAGALGATGLGAGGLAGGLGAGKSGLGMASAGAGGAGGFGPGAGGMAGSPLAAQEAEAAAGNRGNTMPMHGAGSGHGDGEEERERSTWLVEDDDVWGIGGDVPPPVITN